MVPGYKAIKQGHRVDAFLQRESRNSRASITALENEQVFDENPGRVLSHDPSIEPSEYRGYVDKPGYLEVDIGRNPTKNYQRLQPTPSLDEISVINQDAKGSLNRQGQM